MWQMYEKDQVDLYHSFFVRWLEDLSLAELGLSTAAWAGLKSEKDNLRISSDSTMLNDIVFLFRLLILDSCRSITAALTVQYTSSSCYMCIDLHGGYQTFRVTGIFCLVVLQLIKMKIGSGYRLCCVAASFV